MTWIDWDCRIVSRNGSINEVSCRDTRPESRYRPVSASFSDVAARAFVEERARLSDALAAVPCEIEHIGTAVPGLEAKPIPDIAVGIDRSFRGHLSQPYNGSDPLPACP